MPNPQNGSAMKKYESHMFPPTARPSRPGTTSTTTIPLPAEYPQAGGLVSRSYFFLPWVWRARFSGLATGVHTPTDQLSSCC